MEVKSGYKQSEVGIIPEEWDVKPLGEIGCVRMCKRVLKHQTREHGNVPFYKIGTFGDAADSFIPQSLFDEFRRKYSFPKKGDILISAAGTIGRTVAYDGAPAYFQDSNIVWIDNDESKATNAYLWHRYQVTKWSVSHGGTVARLYNDSLRTKIHIPVPSLPEQHAIAEALSDVDGLLSGLDQLIAKKRDLKQATMQQLLTGQTRLSGFHDDWEVKTLKTIVQTPVTDGPHLTPQFLDDGIPFLSVNNLVENRIDLNDLRFISRADHEVFSQKCKPRKNDILLGKAASVGKVALVELDIDFNIWSPIAMIRIDCDNAPRFVYYQLQSADLIRQITLLTNSSSQGNIGMGDIERLTLNLPPVTEQTAIAEVLTDMDAELAALEQRREKTRALKQAMMQELLTGRTRLV